MRKWIALLTLTLVMTLAACGEATDPDTNQLTVTTTLFPHFDIARSIAPEDADVSLVLPAGTSPHDYEPSPGTVADILNSDIFIYTGEMLEPWVLSIYDDAVDAGVVMLEMADFVVLLEAESDHEHDHADDDGHDHGDVDPHFWTDPNNLILMTNAIRREFERLAPDDVDHIDSQADIYVDELNHFDEMFETLRASVSTTTMMHGGHSAFGYFTYAYDLDMVVPYEGFSDDAEPTPGALSDMINTMATYNTEYLFSEALLASSVADTIAEETGAETLVLYSMGKVGADDLANGMTLFDMMDHNLEQFMIGLGYTGPEMDHDHDHDDHDHDHVEHDDHADTDHDDHDDHTDHDHD